jgi:hypothetical protein
MESITKNKRLIIKKDRSAKSTNIQNVQNIKSMNIQKAQRRGANS